VAGTPLFDVAPLPRQDVAAQYAGTGGYSGTAASAIRAHHEIESGKLVARQARIMELIGVAGRDGLTVRELRSHPDLGHHGSISGALNNLHDAGHIAYVAILRDRCGRYVLRGHASTYPAECVFLQPSKNINGSAARTAFELLAVALPSGMSSDVYTALEALRTSLWPNRDDQTKGYA
jgi:hypothetical protein